MVDTFNDEVLNHYLEQKGYTIQKEFLCGSAFFIGWQGGFEKWPEGRKKT